MKTKLNNIMNATTPGSNAVSSMGKILNAPLPAVKAYHLSKLKDKIESEIKQFYTTKNLVIKKLGKEKTKGKDDYEIQPGTKEMEQFNDEINKLLETEVDIRHYNPVELKVEDLGALQLSAIDFASLDPFIKFDLSEKKKSEGEKKESVERKKK